VISFGAARNSTFQSFNHLGSWTTKRVGESSLNKRSADDIRERATFSIGVHPGHDVRHRRPHKTDVLALSIVMIEFTDVYLTFIIIYIKGVKEHKNGH